MKMLLAPFYFLYQAGAVFRNLLYDWHLRPVYRPPLPVISVGNISFGGSEKTPFARFLLHFFFDLGFKPALISRGYQGQWEKTGGVVSDGHLLRASWEEAGDEAFMIAQEFPAAGVFVGRHRFLSCQKAHELGFNLAVLDDGFQHRQLARDIDIVLFSSQQFPFARREPLSSLRRADIILFRKFSDQTSANQSSDHPGEKLRKKFSRQKIFDYEVLPAGFFNLADDSPCSLESLRPQRIIAFSGIAAPQRFFSLLRQEGLQVVDTLSFPDHFSYPSSAIAKIIKIFREKQADCLCTTEKDAIKLAQRSQINQLPVVYLKIKLKIDQQFSQELVQIVQSWPR